MSERAIVIQAEHLAPEAAAWLGRRCHVRRCSPGSPEFAGAVAEAEGLVVRTYARVDERMLAGAPRLRVVGRAGVGLDNIDVPACRRRGIEVVFTPDANTQAVVEYVAALLGSVARVLVPVERAVDAERWAELRRQGSRPQLSELTLGILGLGRIGRRVARLGRAIGFARVLYNDLLEIPSRRRHGARPVPVEDLFSRSDILSLHIDARPANRHFVGQALIGRLGPAAVLINTSRGSVVDGRALAAFLRSRPDALALLDVHDPEPFGADYPLLGLSNARLFPHAAASTRLADANMSWVVRDVAAVLAGRRPRFPAP